MERYGYAISSMSTYSAVRRESSRVGSVKKPFTPSDPHTNNNSESYPKPKITSPITGKCYYHDDDVVVDDSKKHEASYPIKGSDEQHNRAKSPVPQQKVPNEASRSQRSSPLAATDLLHSAKPKPYGIGNNGHGDYNNSTHDAPFGYDNGTDNGYGSYGNNNNNKEDGNMTISPVWNEKYDDAKRGYGGYKPSRSPFRGGGENEDHGGANKDHGGFGSRNNKDGYGSSNSPTQNGKYDGADKGYYGSFGDYNNNNNNNNKERYNPTRNLAKNNNYGGGAIDPNKPKIGTTSWSSSPRKGVQLSQPTNDIDKVMELLKEAAVNDHSNRGGGQKKTDSAALPYDEYENYKGNHDDDGVDRFTPRNSNWAASSPRGKFENGVGIGSPRSQISVPKPGMMMANKNDYGENIERKDDAASWNNGNFGLSSRPQTPLTHVIDGREGNYRTRATGPRVIDSRFVEKIGGTRI